MKTSQRPRPRRTSYLLCPLLLCLCVGSALADTPINLTHDASPNARIAVGNIKGEITITAWDRNQVQVTGDLGSGASPLTIEGSNGDLSIKVKSQNNRFGWGGDNSMGQTTLQVRVPKGASLDVASVSAPVTIDGMEGGQIKANSVSGKVRVNARTPQLNAVSVSGSVEIAGHVERAELQTVSGDILAPNVGSDAKLQTVSGRVRVNGGPWHKLSLSTVSGDVQLGGGVAPGGDFSVDSMSGDVQLQVPANLSAVIHATSFSGDLRSDFGNAQKNDHGPGSELNVTAGSGGGKMSIETFSGDLRIKRGP